MKIKIAHTRGFTLAELLIAITIMGMMITTTLMVYLNVWNTSLRMEMSRELAETARQITERISQDIKEQRISDKNLSQTSYSDGAEELFIGKKDNSEDPKWTYFYGKKDSTDNLSTCGEDDKKNINTHCGLYIMKDGENINLVDAFTPKDKKRVKITDLKFYISGGEGMTKKVTLKMTLELTRKSGVPASLVRASKLQIQSTFSETLFTYQN